MSLSVDARCGYCKNHFSDSKAYRTSDIFGNSFHIAHCQHCGAYSLQPPPDDKLLALAYDDSYYGEQSKKFSFPLVENILDWFRQGRARNISRYLKEGDSLLDIGCGNGYFLFSVGKQKPIKLFGIEPEGGSARRAAQIPGIQLKIGVLEPGDFQPNSLDAITLIHVFEHLTEPATTLDIITGIIKPGGILMMSFPNIDSWQSRMFKGNWLHLDPPRHLFFFRPKDFKQLLKSRGYELISEKHSSLEQNPFGMVQSILNLVTAKREVLFESMKGNKSYTIKYQGFPMLLHKLFFFLSLPVFMLTNFLAALFKKGATVEFVFRKVN